MDYRCETCDADDCKLWRPSHVFANSVVLICWECLERKGHSVLLHAATDELDWKKRRSDQVWDSEIESTNWVPAVPDLNGNWWGYTSVPHWWCAWWKDLPDKPSDCRCCNGSGNLEEFDCMFCKGTGQRKVEEEPVQ